MFEIVCNFFDYCIFGLGFVNLGGFLMVMGFGYDSEDGCVFVGGLVVFFSVKVYVMFVEMVECFGVFVKYWENDKVMMWVVKNYCVVVIKGLLFENFSIEFKVFSCENVFVDGFV